MKKKNLIVAFCAVISAFSVIWASVSFAQHHHSNYPELETGSQAVQASEKTEEKETVSKTEDVKFSPHKTENTNPEKFGLKTEIFSGNTKINSYSSESLDFGFDGKYTDVCGITTFKGNNFRDGAVWGSTKLGSRKFSSDIWKTETGSLASGSGYAAWTGSGWTGQPLIVRWDEKTKSNMNIYPEKKSKQNLTEVIYATMSGEIYFLDLDDGSYTRKPMSLGFTFKGAGALDPRGYPIMYVGAGDYNPSGTAPKMFIINLLDCSVLKEYSGLDSLAHRTWGAFDSSALVCEKTDTLIYPCENGIIYSIHLNSKYDKENGKLSINLDEPVKLKVTTARSNSENYWYGFETSAVFYGSFMYIADNGGYLYCIDMKTLEVIWMQDVVDDTNCSPVLEREGDKVYLYISTSLHWTQNNSRGDIPVFKIDAETGEVVWKKIYNCSTISGTSGGVQGTIALGKNDCENLIYVPLAHYPDRYSGGIAALDKKTGKEVWYYAENGYTWTSPCFVTSSDGKSVLINCDTSGEIVMLDASNGKLLDKISSVGLIEASPSVFNNTMVVGTRNRMILGIKLV